MLDGWQNRLVAAIDAHQARTGEKDFAISKRAGLGQNFVGQLRKGRASPKLDALVKLAALVDASLMAILFGKDLTREEEAFLLAFRQIESKEDRGAYLQILRGMSLNKEARSLASDPPPTAGDKE